LGRVDVLVLNLVSRDLAPEVDPVIGVHRIGYVGLVNLALPSDRQPAKGNNQLTWGVLRRNLTFLSERSRAPPLAELALLLTHF